MNRIGFYEADGGVGTEVQRIIPVENDEAKRIFRVKKKPVFLQIFFHTPMTENEFLWMYRRLKEHGVIDMLPSEISAQAAQDAREHTGTWEFRCEQFTNAFECALELGTFCKDWEGRFTLQISDEPTEAMKRWLKKKDEKNIFNIATELIRIINDQNYAYIGKGAEEKIGCTRKLFNQAIAIMRENGYAVHHFYFDNKAMKVTALTDGNLNWKVEAPLIKRDILKKMAESREEHAL